jgi:hypothetical protein
MERARGSKLLSCNTRELREICREAHRRGLNRQVTPAQFKLFDPKGIHILSPQFMHDKADGELVEPHLRVHAYLKLLGKRKEVERMLDIPIQFVRDYIDENEMIEMGKALKAMQEMEQ